MIMVIKIRNMKNKLKYIGYILGLIFIVLTGCKDNIDPIVEELSFSRVFTPLDLTVKIRNKVTAEISWTVKADADHYVLEFSEDSLEFLNIIKTVTVSPDSVPYFVTLEGQSKYSVRIKGVGNNGIEDSKWASTVFKTDAENIFFPLADGSVGATTATLSWPAGSEVTNFLINPGNIQRDITNEEKANGSATITGLTGETNYTVTLFKGAKQRGEVTFTTLVDLGGAIPLHPEDDLNEAFTNAVEGDKFVLYPGDYTVYAGAIVLNKSISIKGLYPYDMPIVHAQLEIEDGAQSIEVTNIELTGNYLSDGVESTLDYGFRFNTADVAYGTLTISGCNVHNYKKSFIITNTSNACSVESILVDNCIVSDVLNDGGDFIDFRLSYIGSLSINNSTFFNCATENTRDFIRMDGSTKGNIYDDGTRTPDVNLSNCTLYNVMNSETTMKRLFYIRWSQHTIKSESNLLVNMGVSVYSNQSLTMQPECANNNYFNADGYFTEAEGVLIDNSDYTTLDPGFVDAENNNFTVTNQTLLDNSVGDPRWQSQ